MDLFRLSFADAGGNVVPLPGNFNKHTPVEDMRAFACEHGYDASKWSDSHKETLSAFFSHAALERVDDPVISQRVELDPFLKALEEESGLFALDPEIFRERFAKGQLKGIIDGNERLIATINILPKLSPGLKAALNLENHPDNPQVYEAGAGWAARSHRGLGLYTLHRRAVMDSAGASSRLVFSQNYGKGASSVNRREGWTLVNWKDFPFASALMAWPKEGEGLLGGKIQLASGLQLEKPANGFYAGESVSFKPDESGALTERSRRFAETHDWNSSHHLWTNDYEKLERFETHLRQELGVDGEQSPQVMAYAYKQWLKDIKKHSFLVNREDHSNGNGWREFAAPDLPAVVSDDPALKVG